MDTEVSETCVLHSNVVSFFQMFNIIIIIFNLSNSEVYARAYVSMC